MEILIKLAQFFLAFTLMVGVHELGHFLAARACGMRVDKFYLFFNPGFSIFKFRHGHTEYGLGWLPLGGYTKIAGMVDESMDRTQLKAAPQPWEFRSKPAWQRLVVMVSGVFMNFVLAVAIYIGAAWSWGESYLSNRDMVDGYRFNAAAQQIGFRNGDRLGTLDGRPIDRLNEFDRALLLSDRGRTVTVIRDGFSRTINISLDELIALRQNREYIGFYEPRIAQFVVDSVYRSHTGLQTGDRIVAVDTLSHADFQDFAAYMRARPGQTVSVAVARGDTLAVRLDSLGRLGVIPRVSYPVRQTSYTFWQAIPAGTHRAWAAVADYWEQLRLIARPQTQLYKEVGGFISIGNVFPAAWDWQAFWLTVAFLSIVLGVMNLLPIPGLDGGHALFTLYELLTGRKPSQRFMEIAMYIGFALVIGLILYANGSDVYRFFLR